MKVKRIIAIILVTAIVYTGLASLVAWLIIRNDRKKSEANNPTNIENVISGNGGMEIEEEQGSAIRMTSTTLKPKQYAAYGVSEQAESAYTIKATIVPSYMEGAVELQWTAEFQNPNSEWAAGKKASDYVKITPTGTHAQEATVECLQAFGEVIVIKAASKSDTSIFGACTCNYITRYASINAELDDGTLIMLDQVPGYNFSFETTNQGNGNIRITGAQGDIGTKVSSAFTLAMDIHEVLEKHLHEVGFNIDNTTVTYDGTLDASQLQSGYEFETMIYLPGADAAIVGEETSNLVKQAYLWATTGTNDNGELTRDQWEAYIRYRDAILGAWNETDDFLITLTLTQYDKLPEGNVLKTYTAQMDMVATELFPEISAASISLNYDNIDF